MPTGYSPLGAVGTAAPPIPFGGIIEVTVVQHWIGRQYRDPTVGRL